MTDRKEKFTTFSQYFEWADGNPHKEDRQGYFVQIYNGKIQMAANSNLVSGVTVKSNLVVGNQAEQEWHSKFELDQFTNIKTEESLSKIYYALLAKYGVIVSPDPSDDGLTLEQLNTKYVPILTNALNDRYDNIYGRGHKHTNNSVNSALNSFNSAAENLTPVTINVLNPEYDETREYIARSARDEWIPVALHGTVVVRDHGTCQVNQKADCRAGYAIPGAKYLVVERVSPNTVRILIA